MRKEKRGISPVIATVLLIAIVVVIGLIVFLWFRGIIKEEGVKFGKNVRLVCDDVNLEASYSDSGGVKTLSVINQGDVPIFNLKAKISGAGSYDTKNVMEILFVPSEWPTEGLNQGASYSWEVKSTEVSGKDEMVIIPVLLAKTGTKEKSFTCDEEQYGYELEL